MQLFKEYLEIWNMYIILPIGGIYFGLKAFISRSKQDILFGIGAVSGIAFVLFSDLYPPNVKNFFAGDYLYISILVFLISASVTCIILGLYYLWKNRKESR